VVLVESDLFNKMVLWWRVWVCRKCGRHSGMRRGRVRESEEVGLRRETSRRCDDSDRATEQECSTYAGAAIEKYPSTRAEVGYSDTQRRRSWALVCLQYDGMTKKLFLCKKLFAVRILALASTRCLFVFSSLDRYLSGKLLNENGAHRTIETAWVLLTMASARHSSRTIQN
jgi:hypothetical protein